MLVRSTGPISSNVSSLRMGISTTRVVFLGPSLNHSEAATHFAAEYLPPIRRGDLPRVIADGARVIGIIDGEFGQSLAVSVMEICAGLKHGLKIWGAASMGALRAAECQSAGMVGVGWVFQNYVDGFLRADDEVALLFDPRNYRAMTIPLVNIRWALESAVPAGVISEAAGPLLLNSARSIRYNERTFAALLNAAADSEFISEMRAFVEFMKENPLQTDRKRLDALLLLDAMQSATQGDLQSWTLPSRSQPVQ
jgi:TfuA protein